jgi:hypothetical protein
LGSNHGCLTLSGTTNDTVGAYSLEVYYTAEIFHPFFGTITNTGEISDFSITYQLTVTTPGGPCGVNSDPLIVTMLQGDTTICAGESIQLNTLTSGGEMPYSYSWLPEASLSSTTVANPLASPTVPSTYLLTVTDDLGNTATAFVVILIEDPIVCITCDRPASFPTPTQVVNTLTFTWPLEDDALQTQLQTRVKPGQPGAVPDNSTAVANGNITTKSVTIDTINCGRIYQARLRHNCGSGTLSPWKFRSNIITTPCNRLGDFSEKMLVYPNPTSKAMAIQYRSESDKKVVIEISNLAGSTLYSEAYLMVKGMNATGIDVSGYSGGIYTVSVKSNDDTLIKKVVVLNE